MKESARILSFASGAWRTSWILLSKRRHVDSRTKRSTKKHTLFQFYLRGQHNLVNDMGSKCPKDTTRWVAFGVMLKWLLVHRRRLLAHFDDKSPPQAPSSPWWLIAGAVSPLFERIALTFTILQSPMMVISQQRQEVKNLLDDVQSILQICPSPSNVDPSTTIENDDWYVTKDSVITLILDQGAWRVICSTTFERTNKTTRCRKLASLLFISFPQVVII